MKKTAISDQHRGKIFDEELVINYPPNWNRAFFMCENAWFKNYRRYRLRMKKEVAYLNRDIVDEVLYITQKTFITGNIFASATLVVAAKTIIKGLVFGKIIEVKENLVVKV